MFWVLFNNPKLRLKYEHKKLYLEHSHNMNWHPKMHSTLNSHLKLLSILYFFWETFGKSVIVYFKMIHIKWLRIRAYSSNFCNPDYLSINACVWIGKHDMGWIKLIRWKYNRNWASSFFSYHMFYKYFKIRIISKTITCVFVYNSKKKEGKCKEH